MDKLADHVGDHVVLSPEEAVLLTSLGTESSYPRPPQSLNNSTLHAYTGVSLRCSLLSLARVLWRIEGARQTSSQHGRSPIVAAGGLVPSPNYKDQVAYADNTAVVYSTVGCLQKGILPPSFFVTFPRKRPRNSSRLNFSNLC